MGLLCRILMSHVRFTETDQKFSIQRYLLTLVCQSASFLRRELWSCHHGELCPTHNHGNNHGCAEVVKQFVLLHTRNVRVCQRSWSIIEFSLLPKGGSRTRQQGKAKSCHTQHEHKLWVDGIVWTCWLLYPGTRWSYLEPSFSLLKLACFNHSTLVPFCREWLRRAWNQIFRW